MMPARARTVAVVSGITIATLALYTADLGRAPIYLHPTEVLFALHAHSIATTARDSYGRFLPVYFQMRPIGENVWFQAAIVYVTAAFLKVLPLTEWTARLPSAAIGTADVVLIYFVTRRLLHSASLAVAAAALLALTPAHYIQSRIAMDYIYPVVFVLGWLLAFTIFLERRQPRVLFAATTLLGLGMYSYIASLIMMPLYLAFTLLMLLAVGEREPRTYFTAIAGFVWPLTFMVVWVWMHPATVIQTLERYRVANAPAATSTASATLSAVFQSLRRPGAFFGLAGRISQYWSFYDPAYLFLTGGYANVVNSTQHVGVFLAPLAVFVPAGLWTLARRRPSVPEWLVLLGFVTAPLAACLVVPERYALDREMELLPFAVMLAVFGIRTLMASPRPMVRAATWCLLAAVPVHFGVFSLEYFGEYRVRSAFWFEWNRREAFETIIEHEPATRPAAIFISTTHVGFQEAYWRFYLLKHHRIDLLERTAYIDSNAFNLDAVPPRALILATHDDGSLTARATRGDLRIVKEIPEPRDPPFFVIYQR